MIYDLLLHILRRRRPQTAPIADGLRGPAKTRILRHALAIPDKDQLKPALADTRDARPDPGREARDTRDQLRRDLVVPRRDYVENESRMNRE